MEKLLVVVPHLCKIIGFCYVSSTVPLLLVTLYCYRLHASCYTEKLSYVNV